MKKTFLTVMVAAAVAALPLFAHHGGPHTERGYCEDRTGERCLGSKWCLSQPEGHQHTNRCYYWDDTRRDADRQNAPRPQRAPKQGKDVSKGIGSNDGKVNCGTVSAVNKDASTITLVNADGADVVVHISSFTRIIVDGTAKKTAGGNSRVKGPAPSTDTPPALTIDDIPAGSDAIVKAFNTDTKTLEASVVKVRTAS